MTCIKGVIFDKDGTLFDFSRTWEAWAVGFLSKIAGSQAEAHELGRVIGFDMAKKRFHPESIVIAGTPNEVATELAPFLPKMTTAEIFTFINDEAVSAPQLEAVPLRPLLRELRHAGLALGVVTNDAEAPALAHLNSVGVRDCFDFVAGCDSGFGAKPDPGQLNAFLDHTGIDAENCVMVGDSTHDLRAGRQAETKCIGVLTGLASRETLQPFADEVFPDIGHLPMWIGAQNG